MIHPQAVIPWCELMGLDRKAGDLGVELEIEGTNLPIEVPGWLVKYEGSLRGSKGRPVHQGENQPDTPYEYVTNRPVILDTLQKRLKVLYRALTKDGTNVILTPRGSTHIHVNMTGVNVRAILGYMIVFSIIEPVLLRLCGPQRNGNHFCLPSYETGDLSYQTSKIVKAIMSSPRHHWPTKRGKYAALNLDPLTTFGSVEVRCFPNSINPQEIAEWAMWLLHIRGMACDWPDETYMTLLDRAYCEPQWILREIFGDKNVYSACAPQSSYELISFGVEQAYEIAKQAVQILDLSPAKRSDAISELWQTFDPEPDVVRPRDDWVEAERRRIQEEIHEEEYRRMREEEEELR